MGQELLDIKKEKEQEGQQIKHAAALDKLNQNEDKKSKRKRHFTYATHIVLAAFLRAVALELLLIPNHITLGGAVGVASIINWLAEGFLPQLPNLTGVWLLAINIPLLIVAYLNTDKKFALKTGICLVLMAGFMEAISLTGLCGILKTAPAVGENKVLYTLLGGAISGISLPFMLSIQASTGGSDIVTMLLQKRKNGRNYLRVLLYIDIVTIVIAAAVMQWALKGDGLSVLIYSITAQFVAHVVQNQIYKGYSSAYGFDIITDKPEEMSKALYDGLDRGLTGLKVTGMYSKTDKTMIMCVIYKRQLNKARKIVRDVDPQAFATVYTVKEVVGNGFRNTDEDLEDKVIKSTDMGAKKKK